MKIASLLTLLAFANGAPSNGRAISADTRQAITRHLQAKYDEFERNPDGTVKLTGLSYVPEQGPITPLPAPVLQRFLPKTEFFTTTLLSPNLEYMQVELLVSFRPAGTSPDIRSTLSPVYTDTSGKFLQQFAGIETTSSSERIALAEAIGALFASITYQASVKAPTSHSNYCSVQLWHSHLHWRDIIVGFSPSGAVTSVYLVRPHAA